MKFKLVLMFILLANILFAQDKQNDDFSLEDEYKILLFDLRNAGTAGYKSHFHSKIVQSDVKEGTETYYSRGTREINFSQGPLRMTNRQLDFTIFGDGFFKVVIYGRTRYTKRGEFTIDKNTNELMTIDGAKLFDSIKIKPGFIELKIEEDNSIVTIYENGEEINNGYLRTYTLNRDQLKYSLLDEPYFDYSGDVEYLSKSIIKNNCLEYSNVQYFLIFARLHIISEFLGLKWENEQREKLYEK